MHLNIMFIPFLIKWFCELLPKFQNSFKELVLNAEDCFRALHRPYKVSKKKINMKQHLYDNMTKMNTFAFDHANS